MRAIVLNKTVAFDYYLCLDDVFKSVDINFLHMPLPISKMACMHIKDNEGSTFIVLPTKRTSRQKYLAEAKLNPRHPRNQITT